MIWQNPWALLGLVALAVPVLVHLLGRRSARIRKFPTLRFIQTSRLMATRWTRLSDLALLVVRAGIIAAGVVALARPLLLTAGRQRDRGRSVARAIIVDTSASMRRTSGVTAARAVDLARAESQRLASEATTSVILQTAAPASGLSGAAGWLEIQSRRREVIVISDFQAGSIDREDLATVPGDIGVGLVRIEVPRSPGPVEVTTQQGGAEIVARVVVGSTSTSVEWTHGGESPATGRDTLVILAGARERARADAASEAARSLSAVAPAGGRPIAIVHRQYEQRARLMRDARPLGVSWEGDVVARLHGDSMLAAVASMAEVDGVAANSSADLPASGLVVIARTADGRPVALAARGSDRLLLFLEADAGSLASAALIAAAMRASAIAPAVGELEPSTVPEETLESWRRPAASGSEATDSGDGASDGRWFWVLALMLLGIETWMRRTRRDAHAPEMVHERAA